MMGGDLGFRGLFIVLIALLCLLPFGLWKLVEVVAWVVTNVRVTW